MSFTEYYNNLKLDHNNISNWLPKVQDCGIKIPFTKIFEVPEEVVMAFFMEGKTQQENIDIVYQWVKSAIMPNLPRELQGLIFLKNGGFSNKFSFNTCGIVANEMQLTNSLIEINYTSLMFDAGGSAEIAIRERIMYDDEKTACIYKGMPLRNEYRVFYDFDTKKTLYVVNYWGWDYCHKNIARNLTDKIIYEAVYPSLVAHYDERKHEVMQRVDEAMKNVSGLDGIWSIDIMEHETTGELYLIDMAIGIMSAYYDPVAVEAGLMEG